MSLVNAMTVDVEDYFQVSAFESLIPRAEWERWPMRVVSNTDRILALLGETGVRATFFTLGWVAERHPGLVRAIVAAGHELACHGYDHRRVSDQTPAQFRRDTERAKKLLEDTAGVAVIGYRAPSYSVGRDNLWALTVLEALGFRYSSSIYPVKHDLYGMPEAPRFPFHPEIAPNLLEIPVTTVRLGGRNWPCGGGGFFRLYPYALSRWALTQVNRAGQAAVFYCHPWEVDPDQPRPRGLSFKTRLRHYLNLTRMLPRLRRLLRDFRWDTMSRVFLHEDTYGNQALR